MHRPMPLSTVLKKAAEARRMAVILRQGVKCPICRGTGYANGSPRSGYGRCGACMGSGWLQRPVTDETEREPAYWVRLAVSFDPAAAETVSVDPRHGTWRAMVLGTKVQGNLPDRLGKGGKVWFQDRAIKLTAENILAVVMATVETARYHAAVAERQARDAAEKAEFAAWKAARAQ